MKGSVDMVTGKRLLLSSYIGPYFEKSVRKDSKEVIEKIRPNILELIPLHNKIRRLNPRQLISAKRFDLMAKYTYASHRESGVDSTWAKELYSEHLRVFNGFHEPDGSGKSGFDRFLDAFHHVIDSVRTDGFNHSASLIPIGRDNVLLDGSHRLAACLLYSKEITALVCDTPAFVYDYQFFKQYTCHVPTGLAQDWSDPMALEYCKLKENTFIVTVFPSAVGKEDQIGNILEEHGQIVYEKKVYLKNNGPLLLVLEMYDGEQWLGDWSDQFSGAQEKSRLCFNHDGPVRVYVFESELLDHVHVAKKRIRDLFNIGNHSVHINDSHEETLRLARVLLNNNSVYFLNHAKPKNFQSFYSLLTHYKDWLNEQGMEDDHFSVGGSGVMAAYGIREARDLDILCHGKGDISFNHPLINSHNSERHHYPTTVDDIIFNPKNHFYYGGIKFTSLPIVRSMKEKRGEAKDVRDLTLIDIFLGKESSGSSVSIGSPMKMTVKDHRFHLAKGRLVNVIYSNMGTPPIAFHKGNSTVLLTPVPVDGCDIYAYQDAISYDGKRTGTNVLIMNEPIVVLPGQYSEKMWQQFDYVFTWADSLVKRDGKFKKFFPTAYGAHYSKNYIRSIDLNYRRPLSEKKNAICMINGNKTSEVPGELYSKRLKIARWFADHSNIPFDVYGTPPFDLPNYRGPLVPHTLKFETLAQYRFSLAFENCYQPVWSQGYISEKILDCLMCGTIPIYLGCFNIEQYIPPGCYIDYRQFGDAPELERFIKGLTATECKSYLEHAFEWVEQGNLQRFTKDRLYDKLIVLGYPASSDEDDLNKIPWQAGVALPHSNRKWEISGGPPKWQWTDLSTQIPSEQILRGELDGWIDQRKGEEMPAKENSVKKGLSLSFPSESKDKNKLVGIIFSKDRALQLHGTLESFYLHFKDPHVIDFKILYATSNTPHDKSYELLQNNYASVEFIQERNFKENLLSILPSYPHVLFLCDDNIFTRNFSLTDALAALNKNPDTIGFSLRLGENITHRLFPDFRKWKIPKFQKLNGKILKFKWTEGDNDMGFGYPLEVSSSIFRVEDLLKVFERRDFSNPNTLEVVMDQEKQTFLKDKTAHLCFENSVVFNNPLNLVQDTFRNYSSNMPELSSDSLAKKFLEGYRIDVNKYSDFIPHSYHQVVALELWKPESDSDTFARIKSKPNQLISELTSIIIINYNGGHRVKQCLESVRKYTDVPYELIVVDNSSSDGSTDFLRQLDFITLVENPSNIGCPPARRQAMTLAQGEYVLFLDNDTIVTPGWLGTILSHFNKDPEIGLIGPRSNYVSGSQMIKDICYKNVKELNTFAEKLSRENRGRIVNTSRLVGFCMMIKRAVIDKIGGPDLQFGKFGFEDDDCTWRAIIAGYKAVIAHDVFIHHTGGPQGRGSAQYNQYLNEAWAVLKRKWDISIELEYGAPFNIEKILAQPFDRNKHFVPIPDRSEIEPLVHHYAVTPESIDDSEVDMTPNFRLLEGERHFNEQKYESAGKIFQQILRDDPNNTSARNNLALTLWKTGKIQEALQELTRALETDPGCRDAIWNTGQILNALNMRQDALEIYRSFIQNHPDEMEIAETVSAWQSKDAAAFCFKQGERLAQKTLAHGLSEEVTSQTRLSSFFCKSVSPEQMMGAEHLPINHDRIDPYFGRFFQLMREALEPGGSEFALGISLFSLAVAINAAMIIEIGRFKGFSTIALASALKLLDIGWQEPNHNKQRPDIEYTVFEHPKERKLYSIDHNPTREAEERIQQAGLSDYVELINQPSKNAELLGIVDLIFIDGDHSYQGCKKDIDRFVPVNLRPGGYFVLHDYYGWHDESGVNRSPIKKVVDELEGDGEYEHLLMDTGYQSFVVFRKPNGTKQKTIVS